MASPTKFYRDAWLIVAQGGWWKPAEIMAEMPSDLRDRDAHTRLWYMVRTGYLVKREVHPARREVRKGGPTGARPRVEYAVTAQCQVPQGLTAGALAQTLMGRVLQ